MRTGSRVPCSRSPTTEYAARTDGTIAGISSMYSKEAPIRASNLVLLIEAVILNRSIVGRTTKRSGRAAMD
jgi:hypothetical protein